MSRVAISSSGDHLDFSDLIEKMIFPPSRSHHESRNSESKANIPADIVDTPNEFIIYMDVPGLSKSDIQVTVEEENLLVVKSNGKRKRNEEEDEGCKYLRLERRPPQNLMRKFRLPESCDVAAISAKCENGVLSVVVKKLPPPPKSKTVQVTIN
ncbi:17.4 kDa class III heat shock protein [Rutidosis leptorrhynchoides]|uniref:17.4 kDa class III heat shock protein n=1 Tax=Rutidosis leptorrhynchoides TaxID=125765 RepID=UPI003A99A181